MGGLPGRAWSSGKVTLLAQPLAKGDLGRRRGLFIGYPESRVEGLVLGGPEYSSESGNGLSNLPC